MLTISEAARASSLICPRSPPVGQRRCPLQGSCLSGLFETVDRPRRPKDTPHLSVREGCRCLRIGNSGAARPQAMTIIILWTSYRGTGIPGEPISPRSIAIRELNCRHIRLPPNGRFQYIVRPFTVRIADPGNS